MDKEKLIKLAEDLYQSAFDANAYYAIMMQYREMSKKYNNEMNLSPAFYQVVYGALQKACFMEIAKLYDKTKDVVSVGLLLKYCRDNLDLFPEYRDIVTIKEDGREYSLPSSLIVTISLYSGNKSKLSLQYFKSKPTETTSFVLSYNFAISIKQAFCNAPYTT